MFGYVVLHYQNIEITEKCVNALLQITDGYIVIVDNCSPNGSGKIIRDKFSGVSTVHVILNESNLGFAAGNNIGFQYIREHYLVDTVVVMNNDIIIDNAEFEQIISSFMLINNIDVCGPDMVTLKGRHQNPLLLTAYSDSSIRKTILMDSIKIFLFKSKILFRIYQKYKAVNFFYEREQQETAFDCILHGSCMIYGNRYIQNENEAFLPITFMYNEEAILYDYLKYKGYQTGYCSEVTILHMEGASTSQDVDDVRKKVLFRFGNNAKSLKQQLKQRKKYRI